MSFDPAGFVAVADRLRKAAAAAECPGDAALRAAIGRYYYAALLSARNYLEATEPMPVDDSEQTHRWVIRKLRDSADPESQKLTSELNSMRITRNRADYGDDMSDLDGEAGRMAARCGRALGYVATLVKRYSK
ncbi:MAG: hypothetical protein H6722_00030 [Sandaracinus sp.]|nr:hypothetical protein [Sandaracinus sp.]